MLALVQPSEQALLPACLHACRLCSLLAPTPTAMKMLTSFMRSTSATRVLLGGKRPGVLGPRRVLGPTHPRRPSSSQAAPHPSSQAAPHPSSSSSSHCSSMRRCQAALRCSSSSSRRLDSKLCRS